MNRRVFLVRAGGTVLATACGDPSRPADSGSPTTPTDPLRCDFTVWMGQGPYYLGNAPIRNDLDLYGDLGIRIEIRGRVLWDDCSPVVGAIVDLWHVKPDGTEYDDSEELRYRGKVYTDDAGAWVLRTIQPVAYGKKGDMRTAHIHLKIWTGQTMESLVTQLFFEGADYLDTDTERDPNAPVLAFTEEAGVLVSEVDLILDHPAID